MTTDVEIVTLPTIILRNMTVFPNVMIHFDVGREVTVLALEEALSTGTPIFLIGQKEGMGDVTGVESLYEIGTVAQVKQLVCLPGDTMRVMVEGVCRGRLEGIKLQIPFMVCRVELIVAEEVPVVKPRMEALLRSTYQLFDKYLDMIPEGNDEISVEVQQSRDAGFVADRIGQELEMREGDKQHLLQELDGGKRLKKLHEFLRREVEIIDIDFDVQNRAREKMGEHQRDYFLREQIKVIQEELGEDDQQEMDEYREKLASVDLPEEVRVKIEKELRRLSHQSFTSSESAVIRNYVETCLEVPWLVESKHKLNVPSAKRQLEKDHYGLVKVKERILEFLAVRKLAPELKGQVLCLVGPPGVGKTSIAMSIAKALGRDLGRISLGGVSDEAEIRGHRKTYIGAMPGRVMKAMIQAGSNNPVLLLDEIDKLGRDHRGDPSSALLEVLDIEQNGTFRDHYLELPFDLSNVLFITTANTTSSISRPLLDRMEVIEIPSYTDEEKVQICKKYLLPKELERHGMTKTQMKVSDEALREVITGYTHESGVRGLQRQMGTLCRKSAMKIVLKEEKNVNVEEENLGDFLGVKRYHGQTYSLQKRVGIVNGLAWTAVGGELLEVEVNVVNGTGKIILTGNLGDVMKESATTALSLIRSRGEKLGISEDFHEKKDVHIHFPEGGIPKDGPSAGIAITTAIVSALTDRGVRPSVAMTGEVSLRGRVLAIGGLREKSMAALRNGVELVLIPRENEKDLEEIDPLVREKLKFYPVETIDQVLETVIFYEEGKVVDESVSPKRKRKSKKAEESGKVQEVQEKVLEEVQEEVREEV